MTCEDDDDFTETVAPFEGMVHDPLAEDVMRLLDTWGLATVLHGFRCAVVEKAEASTDAEERTRLESIAGLLDSAWVDAEGGER